MSTTLFKPELSGAPVVVAPGRVRTPSTWHTVTTTLALPVAVDSHLQGKEALPVTCWSRKDRDGARSKRPGYI